jgi:dipeptidase E
MQLLLLSNSSNHGEGYLDHAEQEIRAIFSGTRRVLFVPYALQDQEGYVRRAAGRLESMGLGVDGLPEGPAAAEAVGRAEAIFVGGGNTFRLLDRLQRHGLIEPIRARVRAGMPYLGSSAGTVVTAPTIRTTNDMPIVEPASLASLGLVPFQINCHYLDADPASQHMGETREQRLVEFLEENDRVVVGLREGAMLRVAAGPAAPRVTLLGRTGARLFRRGAAPEELASGAELARRVGWDQPA